jgi:UDP-N-acetyl-D-glucosamine dehydrogenase
MGLVVSNTTSTRDVPTLRISSREAVIDLTDVAKNVGQSTVGLVGMGYVGLPTALALLDHGARVIGYDISASRVAAIRSDSVDLLPTDHERLGHHNASDSFVVTTEPGPLKQAETVIIAVPTPVDKHLVPDLRALKSACDLVVQNASVGQCIILTSTTYVGCTRDFLIEPLRRRGFSVGEEIHVAFSPERIDPGSSTHRHDETPRVVGGVTKECAERARQVLLMTSPLIHSVSSPEAAEFCKLLENTFRAVNIAFVNEMSDVARGMDLDIMDIITAAATKPYGFMPFTPGPGVGGHCIPCDPHYLLWQVRGMHMNMPVVDSSMTAIALRPQRVVARAVEVLGQNHVPANGARVLVLGVAYKPGVEDLRESPAIDVIDGLRGKGVDVHFTDIHVKLIRLADGDLNAVEHPERQEWDLVVMHTLHPTANHDWLSDRRVLDATYRLPHRPALYVV